MNFDGAVGRVCVEKNGEMVELGEVHDCKIEVKKEETESDVPANIPTSFSCSFKVGKMKLTKAFKKRVGIKVLNCYDRQDKKAVEALMRRGKRRGRK